MADLKKVIEEHNEKFMACFNANDMKGLANLYTEDCKLMPTGSDTLVGREGPEKVFSGVWESGVRTLELKVKEVGPMGSDVIYERSTYTMKTEGGSVADVGKSKLKHSDCHVRTWTKDVSRQRIGTSCPRGSALQSNIIIMADLKTLVETNNEKFMATFKAGDMKVLANMYTEDCKIMPTGTDTLFGREGPEKVFSGAWAGGARTLELKVEEVGPMGSDVIYERSTYAFKKEDGSVAEAGNYHSYTLSTAVHRIPNIMEDPKKVIEARNRELMDYFKAGDMKAVSNMYTEHCKIMPPREDTLFDREGAEKIFWDVWESGVREVELKSEEVEPMGCDVIYERGTSTMKKGDDLKAAIEAKNQKYMACFKANDMKGVASLYTVDCKIMVTGMDTQYGREATEKALAGVWAGGARALELKSEEIGPMGSDVIYERSAYTTRTEDGSVADVGKSLGIWKKIGEEWFLHIDIFNSNKS
uniref:DUF4440 domain-containing protein n=1 Tax=Branchiostoma floridae TaxID=7739 RepID=C3ZF01_BRAFL|eukprot:XP_002593296.1 hypothetical protein BRAFLDRAFT_83843 [Branchiostoma floridae]